MSVCLFFVVIGLYLSLFCVLFILVFFLAMASQLLLPCASDLRGTRRECLRENALSGTNFNVCPRSLVQFYIANHYIKMVKTSRHTVLLGLRAYLWGGHATMCNGPKRDEQGECAIR